MMRTPIRILLLLVAALSACLASLWLDQQGQWVSTGWVAPPAKAPDLKAPGLLPIGADSVADAAGYVSVQERPVFAPDRRPPPVVQPAQMDPFAGIQIFGVLTGANAGVMARIDGKVRRVKIDENVGAWTLKSINDRSITFTQGDQTRELRLAYAKLNTVTPQPARVSAGLAAPLGATRPPAEDPAAVFREDFRKRNELRAARGLPPVPTQ